MKEIQNFKKLQKRISSWKQGSYKHQSISRCFLITMKMLSSLLSNLYLKNFRLSHCNIKEHTLILVSTSALPPFETSLDWYWQSILFHLTNVFTNFPSETRTDLSWWFKTHRSCKNRSNDQIKGCLPSQYMHMCTFYILLHVYSSAFHCILSPSSETAKFKGVGIT